MVLHEAKMRFSNFGAARIGVLSDFGEPDLNALVAEAYSRAGEQPSSSVETEYWFGIARGLDAQDQPGEQIISEIAARLTKGDLPSNAEAGEEGTSEPVPTSSKLLLGVAGLALAASFYTIFKG